MLRRHCKLSFDGINDGIPAKVAGVEEVILVTPPSKDAALPGILIAAILPVSAGFFSSAARRPLRLCLRYRIRAACG